MCALALRHLESNTLRTYRLQRVGVVLIKQQKFGRAIINRRTCLVWARINSAGIVINISTIKPVRIESANRSIVCQLISRLIEGKIIYSKDNKRIITVDSAYLHRPIIAAIEFLIGSKTGYRKILLFAAVIVISNSAPTIDCITGKLVLSEVIVLISITSVNALASVINREIKFAAVLDSLWTGDLHFLELCLISQLHDLSHDVDDRRNKLVLVGIQRSEKVLDYRAELRVRNDLIERAVSLGYRSRKNCVEDIGDESHDALLESLSGECAGLILNKQVWDAGQILINEQSVEDRINNILKDSLASAVGKLCGKNRFV